MSTALKIDGLCFSEVTPSCSDSVVCSVSVSREDFERAVKVVRGNVNIKRGAQREALVKEATSSEADWPSIY